MKQSNIVKQNVTLWNYLISGAIFIIGVIVMWLASNDSWYVNLPSLQVLLRQFGSLFVVTTAINVLWQLIGKRIFLGEILMMTNISADITRAGLIKITDTFNTTEIPWADYIGNSRHIDLFFAYARTWRGTYMEHIRTACTCNDLIIRLILPNPDDSESIGELARRFGQTKERLIEFINEAIDQFKRLSEEETTQAKIEIWLMLALPRYSVYRFDSICVFALYNHNPEKVPVPTFICKQPGSLFTFFEKEINSILGNTSLTKRILPS